MPGKPWSLTLHFADLEVTKVQLTKAEWKIARIATRFQRVVNGEVFDIGETLPFEADIIIDISK